MKILEVTPYAWRLDGNSVFWRRAAREISKIDVEYLQTYEFRTIFYDVFKSEDDSSAICVGPPLLNLIDVAKKSVYTATNFWGEGKKLSNVYIDMLDRCVRFRIPLPIDKDILCIDGQWGNIQLPLGENFSWFFAGKKVLLTKNKNNNLKWISDWININHYLHGIDGVLFIDNDSSNYTTQELLQYVSTNTAIENFCLLHAPYEFGGKSVHMAPFNSDFLQYGLLEIAHQRFLMQADMVLNCDVDEIFLCDDNGTIESHLEKSISKVLNVKGTYLHCPTDSKFPSLIDLSSLEKDVGSAFFFPPFHMTSMNTNVKYVYRKGGVSLDDQLAVHIAKFADGRSMPGHENGMHYRHFFPVTTGWGTHSYRWKQPIYSPENHLFDCAFVKKMAQMKYPKMVYPMDKVISYAKSIGACPRPKKLENLGPVYDCDICPYR